MFGGGGGGRTVFMAESRVGLGPVCLAPKRRFMMGEQWCDYGSQDVVWGRGLWG